MQNWLPTTSDLWQRSTRDTGIRSRVSDPNDDWITRKLIGELRSEQFDEPDDEHTQVSSATSTGRLLCR